MNISIKIVPNVIVKERAGFTGCDWWFDKEGNLEVRIAHEVGDWREQTVLAFHEALEAAVCRHMGITHEAVDVYDARYRAFHPESDLAAGDEPDCPYKIPHHYGTSVERMLCGALSVDWKPYDDRLSKL